MTYYLVHDSPVVALWEGALGYERQYLEFFSFRPPNIEKILAPCREIGLTVYLFGRIIDSLSKENDRIGIPPLFLILMV